MLDDPSKAQIPQPVFAKLVKQFPLSRLQYGTLPTVDTLLCDQRNNTVAELTSPEAAKTYASKQELAAQLERIQSELNYQEDNDGE